MSGVGGALADVNGRVMLQRLILDKQLSRAFGVLESVYMAGEGLGSFLASLIIVAIGPRWTLLIAGVLLPAVALLGRRALIALDVGIRIPSEEMALLRSTRFFTPLPTPMLERLARNLVPIHVPDGSVVITQGDAGDRLRDRRRRGGGSRGWSADRDAGAGRIVRRDRPDPRCPPDRDRDRHDREQTPGARSGRVPPGHHRSEAASEEADGLVTERLDELEATREP
jgi:hypothetical protein